MKRITVIFSVILVTSITGFSSERINNYASPKTIFDVEMIGKTVWVATSGGLFHHTFHTSDFTLRPSTEVFPDPLIRALTQDKSGNLWVGSDDGYLMMIDRKGKESIYKAYVSAGWRILDLKVVGNYLVVASNKGVSLFDRDKGIVAKNASKFTGLTSSQINVITVHKNRLYLGGESGVAVLKGTLDDIDDKNFYDPTIWDIDTTRKQVVSCLVHDGKPRWFSTPVVHYNDAYWKVQDNLVIVYDGDDIDSLDSIVMDETDIAEKVYYHFAYNSDVKCLRAVDGVGIWIGLEHDFFYFWNPTEYVQLPISGPTFSSASRVHVDWYGNLWVVPFPPLEALYVTAPPWWLGINVLSNNIWGFYGPKKYPEMGHMANGKTARAIIQANDGSMWFGFEGGAIKHFNIAANKWSHYCNYGRFYMDGVFLKTYGICPGGAEPGQLDWGKCDAMAQDGAGYIWFSSWNNEFGSLLCYKPAEADEDTGIGGLAGYYRRFPPNGFGERGVNITAIVVDPYQNIIYGTEKGEVTVIRYDGNPLEDSIETVISFGMDLGLQIVYDAIVISDGTTLILSTNGVYRFDPAKNTLNLLEGFEKNITTMAIESDNIYWYGKPGKGITRFDFLNNTKKTIDRSQGLLSDDVNDIFFDKKEGYVWVATDRGVSRVTLGYGGLQATKDDQKVFPNPFSLRRDKIISFQNIPSDARITVHSLNGNLVGVGQRINSGIEGAYFEWRPPSKIAPGTYFYAVKSAIDVKKSGKLLIVP